MPAPATTASPSAADEEDYDHRLPEWQQWLNRTCENWIFAFIVAMAIRHFCLEAFRIPTASMEPMLYGDPAFSKSDHVVVDKFFFRFTGPKRWGVTVFQFPQPELEAGGDARPAIDADGNRLDLPMVRPLMYRNFVKRAVILPGDRFYIAGGDIHLWDKEKQVFVVSRKPPEAQAMLWQEIYRHGSQEGYLPWTATGGGAVKPQGSGLAFDLAADNAVTFGQPFSNLYLKPGIFRVRPAGNSGEDEMIELSMTKPAFTYRRTNRSGNAWRLDQWELRRMTSADLDSQGYGVKLNDAMTEWVGDIRVTAAVAALSGTASLEIAQGKAHRYQLELGQAGWTVLGDGAKLASGDGAVTGKVVRLAHLDEQLIAEIDGHEVWRGDVASVDPSRDRLEVAWRGEGSITLSSLVIDRDVHYTSFNTGSFLHDDTQIVRALETELSAKRNQFGVSQIELDKLANTLRNIPSVRAQMLGIPEDQLTPRQATGPVGYSPETAITAPAGAYLMLGDNSPLSWDGRCWGWVPAENLRGRVLAVILPFTRWRVVR